MKEVLCFIALFFVASSANAALIFSNVSYTANSVTFTVDGDMRGYSLAATNYQNQFSLIYGGDIWNTPNSDFEANTWSRPVFDNETIRLGGKTGTSGNSYSWSRYASSLADAVVKSATITLTMLNPRLDIHALTPTIGFVWGNGIGRSPSKYTLLQKVRVTASVPEPSSMALLGLGLLGLGFARRRKHS